MLRTLRKHTKVIMIIVILFFVASCFAGYGLYVRGGRGGDGDGMRDYPVAEIDGRAVMRSELERGVARISEQYSNVTDEDMPQLRREVIDSIVLEGELEKEIKAKKIEATGAEIDEAYKSMMDSYPTREEFFAYMQRSGTTERQVKDDIASRIRMQKLLDSLGDEIVIEDSEVSDFYDLMKDVLYKQPAGTKANIATFRSAEAAEAARNAIASGASWDEEIEKHRTDVEMSTPYDHPIILTEQMLSGELAAIKDLPVDQVSQVEDANAPFVYIAINRGHEDERVLSFDEVRDNVRTTIRSQKLQVELQKFFDELRARANVTILDAEIFPSEAEPEAESSDAAEEQAETSEESTGQTQEEAE